MHKQKKRNLKTWESEFLNILSPKERDYLKKEGYDVESLANSMLSPSEVANMIREDLVGV